LKRALLLERRDDREGKEVGDGAWDLEEGGRNQYVPLNAVKSGFYGVRCEDIISS